MPRDLMVKEGGAYGVVGGNIGEGVAGNHTYRGAINKDISHHIAGAGCDGKGLVFSIVNLHTP